MGILTGDNVKWISLDSILDYEQPSKYIVSSTEYSDEYSIPVLTAGQTFILGYTDEEDGIYEATKENPVIIFDDFTTATKWVDFRFKVKSSAMKMLQLKDKEKYDLKYVFYAINAMNYVPTEHSRQWISTFSKFEIPIPDIAIQREISKKLTCFSDLLSGLSEELDLRKEQYSFYREKILKTLENVEEKQLREIIDFRNGKGHEKSIVDDGKYVVVNSKFISTNGVVRKYSNMQISPLYIDDILMVMSDLPHGKALAKCYLVDENDKYTLNQRIGAFHIKDVNLVNTKYLFYILDRNAQLLRYDNGVDQTNLRKDDILDILIPIPSVEQQQKIVGMLDVFKQLCDDNDKGMPAEIQARQQQYEYYLKKIFEVQE